MKPSDSKAARARRKRAQRAREKQGIASTYSERFTPLGRIVAAAADQHRREEKAQRNPPLMVTHVNRDGKQVVERIPIPEPKPRPVTTHNVRHGQFHEEPLRDRNGEIIRERPRAPEPPPVHAAPPVIVPATQRRGEGDPTVKKVLIQRPESNRREWVDPEQIPPGATQPLAVCRQWEERGNVYSRYSGAFDYALPRGPQYWRPDWREQDSI